MSRLLASSLIILIVGFAVGCHSCMQGSYYDPCIGVVYGPSVQTPEIFSALKKSKHDEESCPLCQAEKASVQQASHASYVSSHDSYSYGGAGHRGVTQTTGTTRRHAHHHTNQFQSVNQFLAANGARSTRGARSADQFRSADRFRSGRRFRSSNQQGRASQIPGPPSPGDCHCNSTHAPGAHGRCHCGTVANCGCLATGSKPVSGPYDTHPRCTACGQIVPDSICSSCPPAATGPVSPGHISSPGVVYDGYHDAAPVYEEPYSGHHELHPGHEVFPGHEIAPGHEVLPGHEIAPGHEVLPGHEMAHGHEVLPGYDGEVHSPYGGPWSAESLPGPAYEGTVPTIPYDEIVPSEPMVLPGEVIAPETVSPEDCPTCHPDVSGPIFEGTIIPDDSSAGPRTRSPQPAPPAEIAPAPPAGAAPSTSPSRPSPEQSPPPLRESVPGETPGPKPSPQTTLLIPAESDPQAARHVHWIPNASK